LSLCVVYCSTPSRTLQFNYHWMAQRINSTKYDSSYIKTGDVINIRNIKDNTFLRSHEYQITIYNETFQEVISHEKKLEENDEVRIIYLLPCNFVFKKKKNF
jgi:hypothetical protein